MERGICPIAAQYFAFNILSLTLRSVLVNKSTNITTALYCHRFGSRDVMVT